MYYAYFLWKNLGRKKARTTLTLLSILIAFLLFGLLRSLSVAFNMGAEIAGEDRLVTINKVTLIQPLPYSYLSKITAIEGVSRVAVANWFGGYYQDKKNQFPQFPVNGDEYFAIFSDFFTLPPEQMQAWKAEKIGAVVGRSLANKFNWKLGDRIPLIGMFPQKNGSTTWEFVISGIFDGKTKSADTYAMLLHYDYFDTARQFGEGTVGWFIIQVKDPKQAGVIAANIDALFENSPAETKTSSEKEFAKSFAKQFGDIGFITTLILGAVFFTMLLVAGNTMAQSFRERIPEFAILKTLGFSDISVMLLVLAEAVIISVIGGVIGLLLANVIMTGMAEQLAATLPGLHMSWPIVASGLALIIALGMITGAIPAIQGLRLNIINALRRS